MFGFLESVIILLKTLAVFFVKLGKLDKEVIVTGREFQVVKRELNDIINILTNEDMDDMSLGSQMCNIVLNEF